MRIKKGDKVKVIAGAYKGTVAEVKQAFPREGKVIVEGVNMVKKHMKPTQANPDGGIIEKEAKAKTASRVGYKFVENKDGSQTKVRYYKKSGNIIKD